MEPEEARDLVQQGEGPRVEFNSTFAEEKEAIISLCTFTHTDGGMVLFGVADDRKEAGVSLDKNTIENFSNKL